jgi:hypothetical protein
MSAAPPLAEGTGAVGLGLELPLDVVVVKVDAAEDTLEETEDAAEEREDAAEEAADSREEAAELMSEMADEACVAADPVIDDAAADKEDNTLLGSRVTGATMVAALPDTTVVNVVELIKPATTGVTVVTVEPEITVVNVEVPSCVKRAVLVSDGGAPVVTVRVSCGNGASLVAVAAADCEAESSESAELKMERATLVTLVVEATSAGEVVTGVAVVVAEISDSAELKMESATLVTLVVAVLSVTVVPAEPVAAGTTAVSALPDADAAAEAGTVTVRVARAPVWPVNAGRVMLVMNPG